MATRGSAFAKGPTAEQAAAGRVAEVERIAALGEGDADAPIVLMGGGSDPFVGAQPGFEAVVRVGREEEELMLRETPFLEGRYGACFCCGGRVVIPGYVVFYCAFCGWVWRPVQRIERVDGGANGGDDR